MQAWSQAWRNCRICICTRAHLVACPTIHPWVQAVLTYKAQKLFIEYFLAKSVLACCVVIIAHSKIQISVCHGLESRHSLWLEHPPHDLYVQLFISLPLLTAFQTRPGFFSPSNARSYCASSSPRIFASLVNELGTRQSLPGIKVLTSGSHMSRSGHNLPSLNSKRTNGRSILVVGPADGWS